MISARGLKRRFGSVQALAGVDVEVPDGDSLAVFGPNGAGKSTLLRILSLSLRPDSGELRIAGLDPRRDGRSIRARVGVVSHRTGLYDDLSAVENVSFFAALHGVREPERRARALLDRFGLSLRADDPLRAYSRGMQQRVSVARALAHDPAILLLDEPFTGLDPQAAGSLRAALLEARRDRRTLLMVTHHLEEGLELCERWVVLSRGRVVDDGTSEGVDPAAFRASYRQRVARV